MDARDLHSTGIVFDDAERAYWAHRFGGLVAPEEPWARHRFRHHGDVPSLADNADLARGIYIVCDLADIVVYVGKVDRAYQEAFTSRMKDHHAAAPRWESVWVLRLADHVDDVNVRRAEDQVIGRYQPVGNWQGVSPAARRGRAGGPR